MMTTLSLSGVRERLDGELLGADAVFQLVSTDSRDLPAGALYVALVGERFDGHDFVQAAAEQGAAGALVERAATVDLPQLRVADTRRALGLLGRVNRERFTGTVVGVTGSVGKTTTKNMIAAILSRAGETVATLGNRNNEIGVPLTLLAMEARHRFAVVEMGAARPGDIAYVADLARPDVSLLINAAPAHLEGFGNLATVAQTKGEIYAALPASGTAVLNTDDPYADTWQATIGSRRVVRYGWRQTDTPVDVTARETETLADHSTAVTLVMPAGDVRVHLQAPGRHHVDNALAAAAVAFAVGCSPEQVRAGLADWRPEPGRLQLRHRADGLTVIDDTYNANPASVRAALAVLAQQTTGPRVAILGDMAELGEEAAVHHAEVAAAARTAGIDCLWLVGEHARAMAAAFGPAATVFDSTDALIAQAASGLSGRETVLVKGSRSARMEQVVAALMSPSAEGGA